MYNSHDDNLTWLSPPHDPAPRLMIDRANGMGRNPLTNRHLPKTEDISLNVKVEGGSKLTTPPKPTKKESMQKEARHSYKEYKYDDPEEGSATTNNHINNSRYSDSLDPSTESLLTSLAPYFENEEALKGLDKDTIRQLLHDHPELAEAAREFEKARVIKKKNRNKESLSSRTTKSKQKKRFNSSKNEDRYDGGSSTSHHRSQLDGSSHIDAMVEAGIPIKSWFIVCLLIGAGAYQLRKIICEPSSNKRNSRKKGKNYNRETIINQRSISTNKNKSKQSKTHNKKKLIIKKNQNKNNTNKGKSTKEVTNSEVTKSGKLSQSTQNNPKKNGSHHDEKTTSNEHNSRSKPVSIKKRNSEKKTVTTKQVEGENGKHTHKHFTEVNHNGDDAESEQHVSQLKKITREVHPNPIHQKSVDDGVMTSTDTFQHESLHDYCEEDMNAIIEAINGDSLMNSSDGEWKIAGRRCKKRHIQHQTKVLSTIKKTKDNHPPQKLTKESSTKKFTPKITSTKSDSKSKGTNCATSHTYKSTEKEINLIVSKNEECRVPSYDDKPRNIINDNEDDENVLVSNLKDDTADDAALALKLQREEESRFEDVNKVDEEWEIVKTKRQRKISTIKEAK